MAAEYLRRTSGQPVGPPEPPRLSEFSPERRALTDIVDYLRQLIHVTIALTGGKPTPPGPSPRPVTALERLREAQREAKHRWLVALVLPAKNDPEETTTK